ncbi:MAG: hypothetical protein ACYTBJ_02200 [Planctomycetota bacterium]|jgi:chromosome segregation ATPase
MDNFEQMYAEAEERISQLDDEIEHLQQALAAEREKSEEWKQAAESHRFDLQRATARAEKAEGRVARVEDCWERSDQASDEFADSAVRFESKLEKSQRALGKAKARAEAAEAENAELRAQVERLRGECFALSAGVCDHLRGDDYGNTTCEFRDRQPGVVGQYQRANAWEGRATEAEDRNARALEVLEEKHKGQCWDFDAEEAFNELAAILRGER